MLAREGVRIDEDGLTHAVLGLMRYLPPELWFIPFVQELRRRNSLSLGSLEKSSNPDIKLWPSYLIPSQWKHAFWHPRGEKVDSEVPTGSICPDALITTEDWIMLVASEYSHDMDAEQLFQQFALASHERRNKEFFVLLINRAFTRPSNCAVDSGNLNKPEAGVLPEDSLEKYISACCTHSLGLEFTEYEVKRRMLWINWQSLNGLFGHLSLDVRAEHVTLPGSFLGMVRRMRDDVCELLEREGLFPISFDIVDGLAYLFLKPVLVPSLASIKPIINFLGQISIDFERIPSWHDWREVHQTLMMLNLRPENITVPHFSEKV